MRWELVNPTGHFQVDWKDVPRISTMHSLGLQLVKKKARSLRLRKTDLIVLQDEKAKRLLYRDAALLCGLSEADADAAATCKQRGDCRQDEDSTDCKVCEKYWEIMSKCNALDYDDQVLFACRVLEADPDLLALYQSRASHLLVDEYQDINAAQFRMIELLSRTSRDGLFVVGDDAQSIYGFRGADPGLILHFETDFPGAATPPLSHSRRCHKAIVDDAVKILQIYYPHNLGT
ncbi:MAG: ATP-dependent helicase [Candidatus Eisenbacteria sp.]|nr:ATP-dependent helicase [Candidatus Eisenbacteria bacterium]